MRKCICLFTIVSLYYFNINAQIVDWSNHYGGDDYDVISNISHDSENNLYVTGSFTGTAEFNHGGVSQQLNSNGGGDMFLMKLNSQGELVWLKQIGGGHLDYGQGLSIDTDDNIYVVGRYAGIVDFDPSGDELFLISEQPSAEFVCKFNGDGELQWANSIQGQSFQSVSANQVVIDGQGNAVVTGFVMGMAYFENGEEHYEVTSYGGQNADVFVSKYSPNGDLLMVKTFGGESNESCFATFSDHLNNIVIAGSFLGESFFDESTNQVVISNGSSDIYIAKLNTSGDVEWAKSFGGEEEDYCLSVVMDNSGNIYHSGIFSGSVSFQEGQADLTLNSLSQNDVYLSKLSSEGTTLWVQQIIGNPWGIYSSITLDGNNNIIVTGYFSESITFNNGVSETSLVSETGRSTYIAKYDTNGNFLWAYMVGSDYHASAVKASLDASENLFVAGYFGGTMYNGSGLTSAVLVSTTSISDGFILKVNSANSVGIDEFDENINAQVYPNPVSSVLNIFSDTPINEIRIYNAVGKLVRTENKGNFSVNDLPQGVYLMKVQTNLGNKSFRFVKE